MIIYKVNKKKILYNYYRLYLKIWWIYDKTENKEVRNTPDSELKTLFRGQNLPSTTRLP